MIQISIRKGKMFSKGINYAKRVGGTYQPGTQTWSVPNTPTVQRMLNAPGAYGWSLVTLTSAFGMVDVNLCPHCGTYCDGDCRR